MAATEFPSHDIPAEAPITSVEWIHGEGEKQTEEWTGTKERILARYITKRGEASIEGSSIAMVRRELREGLARLVVRHGREFTQDDDPPPGPRDVMVIEELYAVDMIKDIRNSKFYTEGTGALYDEEAVWVTQVVDEGWDDNQITAMAKKLGKEAKYQLPNWTYGMRSLKFHLSHGHQQYMESSFVFRRSKHGKRTAALNVSFAGVNTVVSTPSFQTQMGHMVSTIAAGEWIKKSPYIEYSANGNWRATEEFHWAEKWSEVYGGSWHF